MDEDVSRKTIVVLVILTVLVSTIGTLTVLNSVDDNVVTLPGENTVGEASLSAQGIVSVNIAKPTKASGEVKINIIND